MEAHEGEKTPQKISCDSPFKNSAWQRQKVATQYTQVRQSDVQSYGLRVNDKEVRKGDICAQNPEALQNRLARHEPSLKGKE